MLTTQRLSLRPFLADDAASLYEFMGDARAMRYTYSAPSLQHCTARLKDYESMRTALGFAPWVVFTQAADELVGWGGLSVDKQEPEWGLEVSYAFAPAHWGKGYATELVQHAVAFAFDVLCAPEVHAFAMPQNASSVRVLEKCDFGLLRYEPRLERNHYLITACANRVRCGALRARPAK